MDIVTTELLESWNRQSQILTNLVETLNSELLELKPSEDGMPIFTQLGHIHDVRKYWLDQAAPSFGKDFGYLTYRDGGWVEDRDLPKIKEHLAASSTAVFEAVKAAFEDGTVQFGPYTHPVHYLQHMIWHEGYHFGLLMLALRLGGHEPTETWEEQNIWGIWRTEESS